MSGSRRSGGSASTARAGAGGRSRSAPAPWALTAPPPVRAGRAARARAQKTTIIEHDHGQVRDRDQEPARVDVARAAVEREDRPERAGRRGASWAWCVESRASVQPPSVDPRPPVAGSPRGRGSASSVRRRREEVRSRGEGPVGARRRRLSRTSAGKVIKPVPTDLSWKPGRGRAGGQARDGTRGGPCRRPRPRHRGREPEAQPSRWGLSQRRFPVLGSR